MKMVGRKLWKIGSEENGKMKRRGEVGVVEVVGVGREDWWEKEWEYDFLCDFWYLLRG